MVGNAVGITVNRFQRIIDIIVVGIGSGLTVEVDRIIDSVPVRITVEQRRAAAVFNIIRDIVVVGVSVEIIGDTVPIGICDTLDDICNAVSVTVDIEVIRLIVGIVVRWHQCIIDTVQIDIAAARDIDIQCVVDAVTVGVRPERCGRCVVFDVVADTVVVRVGIEMVGAAIPVRIYRCATGGFNNIRDAIVVAVDFNCIGKPVIVRITGFDTISDTVAVAVSATDQIYIERIINAVVVTVGIEQCGRATVFQCITQPVVVRVRIKIIRCAVTVAVGSPFQQVNNAVSIRVDIEMVGQAISVCVGG